MHPDNLKRIRPYQESDWFFVNTHYACGGVVVKDGIIIDAAPYFNKAVGNPLSYLKIFGASIEHV